MLNRQLFRKRGETQQPLPPAPRPAMWQCMSTMPAGIGSTGRNGRARRQIQMKPVAMTATKRIFRRRMAAGDFNLVFFMASAYGQNCQSRELIKLGAALKKPIVSRWCRPANRPRRPR